MSGMRSVFDKDANVSQYLLTNKSGNVVVKVIDYGAIVTNLLVKDATGVVRDIVLGFDTLQGYKSPENAYFGAVVGRVANRIANASFHLNGKTYQLAKNTSDGSNHLHGGLVGFDQKMWTVASANSRSITLEYTSPDAEEQYPGKVRTSITYTVTDEDEVRLDYSARLDDSESKDTIINLTNHTYFNLSGADNDAASKILDHRMVFSEPRAENITGVLDKNSELVPNGRIIAVDSEEGAAFDFYQGEGGEIHTIGSRIDAAGGYDHAFIFRDQNCDRMRADILTVWSPLTNICLTMSTTEPAVQFYTGEYLSEKLVSKIGQKGVKLGIRSAFCLEANRYPDAINHPEWKDQVILSPGQVYKQTTVYKLTAYHKATKRRE